MQTSTILDPTALGPTGLALLTTERLADETGIPLRTWTNFRARGGGPPYLKIGDGKRGRVYYQLHAVQAWLAEQARQSTTDG